jgi:hypothetical protein
MAERTEPVLPSGRNMLHNILLQKGLPMNGNRGDETKEEEEVEENERKFTAYVIGQKHATVLLVLVFQRVFG